MPLKIVTSLNKLEGSGGMLPPGKSFKIRTLRSLLRPCLGQNATRISPSVVSVGTDSEGIEPSFQK